MTAVKQNRPLAPIYLGVKPLLDAYSQAYIPTYLHIPGIDAQNIVGDKLAVITQSWYALSDKSEKALISNSFFAIFIFMRTFS